MSSTAVTRLAEVLRRRTGRLVVDNFFRGIAHTSRAIPVSHPALHGVERIEDVRYRDSNLDSHLLDVYRPADAEGPLPVVFYSHGGAFRILSKDSHWLMGLAFARAGYLVFNINYRLAPRHPYPAAMVDACEAFRWVVEHAESYGGDLDRLVIAGESAGANIATSLTLSTCYERPEPWARRVYETGIVPRAVVPACGMLQATDGARFQRRRRMSPWVSDRLEEVTEAYVSRATPPAAGGWDLADPLVVLERGDAPDRPLPPFFVPVGTRDPLLDDTRRLEAALDAMGVPCQARYYPGEVHAFHAFLWRKNARRCWADTFRFLDETIPRG